MDDPGPHSKAEFDANGTTTPSGFASAVDGGRVLSKHELHGDSAVAALLVELEDHTEHRSDISKGISSNRSLIERSDQEGGFIDYDETAQSPHDLFAHVWGCMTTFAVRHALSSGIWNRDPTPRHRCRAVSV